jgi:hypothetical protein
MGRIYYDIPLVEQGDNPICWVACMAMIASHYEQQSITIGSFTGGFDPWNSCIADPAGGAKNWDLIARLLTRDGFTNVKIEATQAAIEQTLKDHGPFILTHYCGGFPYGAGWATPPATATHAVVITGYDSAASGGWCWMNNPWGNKDRAIRADAIVAAITAWRPTGLFQVSYWTT